MAYTTRAEIELAFGTENVKTWADMENTGDPVHIAARIAWAIEEADNKINMELGYRYSVPIDPIPAYLKSIATKLAAVKLYESRGVQDSDPMTNQAIHRLQWHQRDAEASLARLRLGVLSLDGSFLQNAPGVVTSSPFLSAAIPPYYTDPFML